MQPGKTEVQGKVQGRVLRVGTLELEVCAGYLVVDVLIVILDALDC